MKLILSSILLFHASMVFSQFSVDKIKEITGIVKDMQCFSGDSYDICYVLTNSQILFSKSQSFYTVTSSGSRFTVSEHKLKDTEDENKLHAVQNVVQMVVNDHHTVYLFAKNNYSRYSLWMKKEKWDNFILVYKWTMDKNSRLNALFSRGHNLIVSLQYGLVAFARDEIVPISIFPNYEPNTYEFFETDLNGNVYFKAGGSDALFRITEDPGNKVPVVEKLYDIYLKDNNDIITSTAISRDGYFYFASANSIKNKSLAKIFKWDEERKEIDLIHSQWNTEFNFFCSTKDRLYFTSENKYIYFINRNQSLGGILTHLKHRPSKNKCIERTYTYGNEMFFPYDNMILKIDGSYNEVTKISAPSNQSLTSILTHSDNSFWVMGKELYLYDGRKFTAVPNLVLDESSVVFKRRFDESLVVGTKSGLYVVRKI